MTLQNPFKKKQENRNSAPVRPAATSYATFTPSPDLTSCTPPVPKADDCGSTTSAVSHDSSASYGSGSHSSHSSYDSGSHSSGSYDSGSSGCDSGGGF